MIQLVELAVTVVDIIVAVAAIVSAVYIVYIYRQRHESALFLDRLVRRNIRVSIASAVIVLYIVLSLFHLSPGRPWGAVIISLAVVAMMWGPTSDALLWHKERGARK